MVGVRRLTAARDSPNPPFRFTLARDVLVLDDLGVDKLGIHGLGTDVPLTPNLDHLAEFAQDPLDPQPEMHRAIRNERYKLTLRPVPPGLLEVEFYDLMTDPFEVLVAHGGLERQQHLEGQQ